MDTKSIGDHFHVQRERRRARAVYARSCRHPRTKAERERDKAEVADYLARNPEPRTY